MDIKILQVDDIVSINNLDVCDYVVIKELGNKKYKILNNIKEMDKFKEEYYVYGKNENIYLNKAKFKKDALDGAIVNFEFIEENAKNSDLLDKARLTTNEDEYIEFSSKFESFINMVFIDKFEFNYDRIFKKYYSDYDNYHDINIENCYFKEANIISGVDISNSIFIEGLLVKDSVRLSIDNTTVNGELKINNFKSDDMHFRDVEVTDLTIEDTKFNAALNFNNLTVNNNFQINNCEFNYSIEGKFDFLKNGKNFLAKECSFKSINVKNETINCKWEIDECKFEEKAKFSDMNITKDGAVYFKNTEFYASVVIDFKEIKGKFYLYKTSFGHRCLLDYEKLQAEKYRPFEGEEKYSKWTFFNASEIYKQNGKIEQYLDTYYMYKKHESKGKQGIKLLDGFVDLTTKYFTSWKRTVYSMIFVIIVYFLIYMICSGVFKYGTNYTNRSWYSVVGNSMYLSLITFTTVGYGDIVPHDIIKLFAASEGILGVYLTSSFLVTLTRKYT
ncbi:hypothetical protein CSC2_06480 [Clostridium zeae]|uniref:Potassium channel domain-containing protein n=1 Tax=Clostridium zeae TaxID=2759022 RepID=A0ABQ1E5U2_9CLOT|nr:potassium channel family protein [Clostridium zeae]GFZ30122.1 hypothetical protein CSC2_06480 [Clostridium zeae]